MYHPRVDVTHRYHYIPVDFIKHLFSTTVVILILTMVLSAVFREPVRPALKISQYAQQHPIEFERVAMGDLTGTGTIASYGPPYNNGHTMVQDALQQWVGVIHPVNAKQNFVLTPLADAAHLDPALAHALSRYNSALPSARQAWETRYDQALAHATVMHGRIQVPPGSYGPIPAMMNGLLHLGQSGLMAGALERNPADYQFDNQNPLLFLQGKPLHNAAAKLELKGEQWGIIHEENAPFPGPWWMTIVTAIYQIPFIANASAADAIALGSGLILFVILMLAPWIPILNRLPRYFGVHKLIWRSYYQTYYPSTGKPTDGPGKSL